jgi:hypothetical protein
MEQGKRTEKKRKGRKTEESRNKTKQIAINSTTTGAHCREETKANPHAFRVQNKKPRKQQKRKLLTRQQAST